MPNTREKLCKWICDVIETDGCMGHCNYPPCYLVKAVADHLIANGVTFAKDNNVPSKWIPVTERLPEVGQRILVYCESKTIEMHITCCTYMGGRFGHPQFSRHCRNVTHWMPLPEPPKGE